VFTLVWPTAKVIPIFVYLDPLSCKINNGAIQFDCKISLKSLIHYFSYEFKILK